uniref:Competence protein ComEC n=1 Tax=Candidatus Kentrum sp. TUN TaxID=2126343 RepID=A0A450ZD03_9GAMM|nr:MAG: competence protein ComEC [Candidatus Kentron sp. TUN]VFK53631.1 MAG: competence protein ComEC [Candidatus Kentron sp. TUN]
MRVGAITFLSGILLLASLSDLPDAWFVGFLPVLVFFGVFSSRVVRMVAWFGTGFLWALFRAEVGVSNILPTDLEGHDLVVDGIVASIPIQTGRKTRFLLDVRAIEPPAHVSNSNRWGRGQRIRLNWYGKSPQLLPGERWRLTVRLKRPRGFRNPGGFDYEKWLFQQGIRATGYVKSKLENRKIAEGGRISLTRLRYGLARVMEESLADSSHAGIVKALAIGVRDDVTERQWTVLRATGTAHLMAISGLHIGLITTLIFFGIRKLWTLSTRMALVVPAQRVAALMAIAGAFGYAALAGFSLPTQRALVMVCVVMVGIFRRRHIAIGLSLASALFVVLWLEPFSVLSMGFWLSFGAVAVILFGMTGHLSVRSLWWRWSRVQILVAIGLFPLTLLFFQQHPLVSPIANLVVIPWIGFVVVPLVLAGTCLVSLFPDPGGFLLGAGNSAIVAIWPFIEHMESLGFVYQKAFVPALWTVVAGGIGVVLLLLPRGIPGRWLGMVWLLPLFFISAPRPNPGEVWFSLLDVGQGLAVVLRTREHVLVYDVGPAYSANFDAGRAIVIPFLRSQGIRRVDRVITSHSDRDHIGGLKSLLTEFPVGILMTNGLSSIEESIPMERHDTAPCRDGTQWNWDGVDFRILHPAGNGESFDNDDSCVLGISSAGGAILLTGDVEYAAERRLIREHADEIDADILVVPHHGSRTSSSEAFVEAVKPRYALFSVGYRNRFRLPSDTIVTRYQRNGAHVLSSDRHGAIGFRLIPGKGILAPTMYREEVQRFWHR